MNHFKGNKEIVTVIIIGFNMTEKYNLYKRLLLPKVSELRN